MKKIISLCISLSIFLSIQAAAPTITSFSPTSGVVGAVIYINGTGFSTTLTNNIVYFGPVKATISAATTIKLTVNVPSGSAYAPITVLNTVTGLSVSSSKNFTTSFSPAKGSILAIDFAAKKNYSISSYPQELELADFDVDGKSDIAVSCGNGSGFVSVYRNTGSINVINFDNEQKVNLPAYPNKLSVGDIDGDGKIDIIVPNSFGMDNFISILRNTSSSGAISFATYFNLTLSMAISKVFVSDIDMDGKPDLLFLGSGKISCFRNTSTPGNLSFDSQIDLTTSDYTDLYIGDIDGDRKPDICSSKSNSSLAILINTSTLGSLSFTEQISSIGNSTGTIGDIDGDGKADIVYGSSNNISILHNTSTVGSVSFNTKSDFSINGTPSVIKIGDLDGDGKPDLASAIYNSNSVSVLGNTSSSGSVSFSTSLNLPTGNAPTAVVIGDLNGDGRPELASSNFSARTFSVLYAAPTITSFTPTSAGRGTTVTITGTNFTGTTTVMFGATAASSFIVVNSTTITAVVGSGSTGLISVTTDGGTATSADTFTWVANPITVTNPTNTTPNLAPDYPTLVSAIAAINSITAMSGPVIFNVAANYTETAPTGGYILGNATLNALTSNTKTITFRKTGTGSNPLISAFTGTGTMDGIFIIQGADNIVIDGIDLHENAINTDATKQMEWGYALLKRNELDGAQNIAISNATITLNKTNVNSKGIYGANHTPNSTTELVISSTTGINSTIKINACVVTNCYNPIYVAGYSVSAYNDTDIEIGRTAGNTITNFGNSNNSCVGISLDGQKNSRVENNTITTLCEISGDLAGIAFKNKCSGDVKIYNNTVSISSNDLPLSLGGILTAGTYTSIDIQNNVIENCNFPNAEGNIFMGLGGEVNGPMNIVGNRISGNIIGQLNSTFDGNFFVIYHVDNTVAESNISSNTVRDNIVYGNTTIFAGIVNIVNDRQIIDGNLIYNNSIHGTANGSDFYGIYSEGTSLALKDRISNNAIYSNNAKNLISGIMVGGIGGKELLKNKIYNLNANSSTGVVNGINLIGGIDTNIYNNLIGNLNAPTANSTETSVRGINIEAGDATSIFYNTINLNSTSTGSNFSTAAIKANTAVVLEMRNNILVNTSTAKGTGKTSALEFTDNTLTNFSNTSNNNLYYAGTPSASKVIMYDGTNAYQTLAAYRTALGDSRESAAISEMPIWLSTDGTNANFLHINGALATEIYGGGVSIPYYTDDYDGNTRKATPDIGADEFEAISISNLSATNIKLTTVTLGATISPDNEQVIDRGICWSNNAGVAITDNKTSAGGTTGGAFTVNISDLTRSETYYFRGYVVKLNNETVLSDEVSFSNVPIFTGTGYWDNPARWNVQEIPGALTPYGYLDSPIINGNCTLSLSYSPNWGCVNLTINTGAKLIIKPEHNLAVSGLITNNAGAEGLVIQSEPSMANASIYFASGTPRATVEMYSKASWDLTKPTGSKYSWQFFGIPVKTLSYSSSFSNCYVRKYDETSIDDLGLWDLLSTNSVLTSGTGYEVVQQSAKKYQFVGELTNEDFSRTLAHTANGIFAGQHIFANPYTTSIYIGDIGFGANTEQSVYLFNTGTYNQWRNVENVNYDDTTTVAGQYTVSTPNTLGELGVPTSIPSMQGFLVKTQNSLPGSINISYASTISNFEFQRARGNKVADSPSNKVITRIDLKGSRYADCVWIFSDSACTRKFDNGWDGYKMKGAPTNLQLYATEADGDYQIDAVKDINETYLAFQAGQDTVFKLTFTNKNLETRYAGIYLVDLVTNQMVDVSASGSEYHFKAYNTPEPTVRFKIVTKPSSISTATNKALKVFSTKEVLVINNQSSLAGNFELYSVAGSLVKTGVFATNGMTSIATKGLPTGAYIVKAMTSGEKVTERVIIN